MPWEVLSPGSSPNVAILQFFQTESYYNSAWCGIVPLDYEPHLYPHLEEEHFAYFCVTGV